MRNRKQKILSWWKFTGENEIFQAEGADKISRLYFPLCNEAGLLSSITPRLQGDIKTGQNSFLTPPVSTEDLHNARSGRNFWVMVEGRGPWSAVGASAHAQDTRFHAVEPEKCRVEAGALWHRVIRENKRVGLSAEITNFVPAAEETLEIMVVKLTNLTRKPLRLTPTAAIPIYGRSADNVRDHRHVTSLLHRIFLHSHGVIVQPTMSFDERGHQMNSLVYAVLGCEGDGEAPVGSFPSVASFIGEGGSFDAPQAVVDDLDIPDLSPVQLQGREAVGALRFKTRKLAPSATLAYVVLMGIAPSRKAAEGAIRMYGSLEKTDRSLEANRSFWKQRLDAVQIKTGDDDFNRWTRWVTLQPMLRKIFGNSFLPDFDYGRGGRGWRDLWQDSLALLLMDTGGVREQLLNHFGGVRMRGTNATVIGRQAGEFVADRNNISRVWMDHGVWPHLTTELYLHQTGDWGFLTAEAPYFWDQDRYRKGDAPKGSVLEHLLVQHLTAYFNVGEHGNCRLEDADWNDGLDMAHERGESIAFTAVYAGNLRRLSAMLQICQERALLKEVSIAEELEGLLESKMASHSQSPDAKQARLKAYRSLTQSGVTGRKTVLAVNELIADLRTKGQVLADYIRQQEWIDDPGCFNGYYDNDASRVEGEIGNKVRMTLPGQVFPILSGVATEEQVRRSYLATKKLLQDKKLGGFRLNTDFGENPPPLGRAFYFAYGEKENGSFFSHMMVMFAYGLFQRGFVAEGHEVLSSLYRMCRNVEVAKIYPGLPEYFNGEGRGLYAYLTGSASWFLLTFVTQVLGIRGQWGDLLLAPKLMPDQFGASGQAMARVPFAGKLLNVNYFNRGKKPFGKYRIESALVQGRTFPLSSTEPAEILIPRNALTEIPSPTIDITLALS